MIQSRKGTDAVTCQQVGGKVFCFDTPNKLTDMLDPNKFKN